MLKPLNFVGKSLAFVFSIIPLKRYLSFPARRLADFGISLYAVLILLWLLSRVGSVEGLFLMRDRFLFAPGDDRSYFEAFQYMFLGWNSLVVFRLTKKLRERFNPLFLVWFFLFIDDFLRLHDGFGSYLLQPISLSIYKRFSILQAFVRAKDISEFMWWMLVASVLLALVFMLRRYVETWNKQLLLANLQFFVSLAFFGIFIDVVHANIDIGFLGNGALTLVEESGEFLAIMAAFIYHYNMLIVAEYD